MAATRIMPDKREINVFSQLLCCLVGMGYQCQQFTLDAWSFGSPQSRTRLFLSIAAPGQRLRRALPVVTSTLDNSRSFPLQGSQRAEVWQQRACRPMHISSSHLQGGLWRPPSWVTTTSASVFPAPTTVSPVSSHGEHALLWPTSPSTASASTRTLGAPP